MIAAHRIFRPLAVFVAVVVSLGLASAPALAATIRVTGADTLQSAVDRAADGDTILVLESPIAGPVVIDGFTDLTLRGKPGVVVDANAGPGLEVRDCSGLTIRDLAFVNAEGSGILVIGGADLTLSSVIVRDCGGIGIEVGGVTGGLIEGALVTFAGEQGLLLDGPGGVNGATAGVRVRSGRVLFSGGDGIETRGDACPVERSTVEDPAGVGICTRGARSPVSRCTVTRGADTGIATSGVESGVFRSKLFDTDSITTIGDRSPIERCKGERIGDVGFRTTGADSPIVRSRLVEVEDTGLRTSGDRSPIVRCTVTTSVGHGIQTFGDDSPVERSKVSVTVSGTAIQTFGERSGVGRSRATDAGRNGIRTSGIDSVIDRSRVTRAANIGIEGNADGNDILRCVVKDCGGPGIEVDGGLLAERNKVTGSLGVGLLVGDAGAQVRRNTVSDSGGVGLIVEGAGNTVESNTVRGSADDGLRVSGTGNAIRSNRVSASGGTDLIDTSDGGGNTYAGNQVTTQNTP